MILVVLVLVYSWSQAPERTVLSWSNGLVWWALGSAAAPLYFEQSVVNGSRSNRWVVRGEVQTIDAEGGLSARLPYEALVELRCPVANDPLCWHLEELLVEGVAIDIARPADWTQSGGSTLSFEQHGRGGLEEAVTEKTLPSQSTDVPDSPAAPDDGSERANSDEEDQAIEADLGPDEPVAEAPDSELEPEAILVDEPVPDSSQQVSAVPRDEQSLVMEIQRQLTQEGYDTGPVDGVFGPRTSRAIAAFQTATGRPADGQPSEDLLNLLLRRALDR